MAKPLARAGLLAVAGLALAILVLLAWPRPRLDPAVLAGAGAGRQVRILRDTWGIPHVFGRTDADTAYGLAWAHAEDDFDTIQLTLLAARGQLATALGTRGAPNDYMVGLLRVREVVEGGYARDLAPSTRALCEGYADGLNHFAAKHPERALRQLYPVRGEDIAAGFVHKGPLFFGLDKVLKALFESEGAPDLALLRRAEALREEDPRGSNTLAVAPRRSSDGATRLVVNSHQPWSGPVAWYEAHLHSEEGWDMVGGTFPGAPLILHGHNRNLGWAHTVNRPDLVDVFRLETNPQDPDEYRFEGAWRRLEKRPVSIEVSLLGPLRLTVEREALWSVHGPVVRRPHGAYALRFAGYGEVRQVEQWYRMNKAARFGEWWDAMQMTALPMFNCGYADREGHIGYLYNARLPLRARGYDWKGVLPGDTADTLWQDFLPAGKLPRVVDPPSGFIQNCNSTPFRTTTGEGNPRAEDYAEALGIEARMTNRALRALELLGADESISREELDAYKFDLAFSLDSEPARRLQKLLQAPEADDPATRRAVELLRRWDRRADAQSREAALALLVLRPDDANTPDGASLAELQRRARAAARQLQATFGRVDVPLGEVQRLRRGAADLPLGGAPDALRAVYARPDADGRLLGLGGDSYVLIAEWDAGGRVSSRAVHPFGSATLERSSPHYADQSPLFARTELRPVWLEEAEIRAHLSRDYRPGDPDPH